MAVVPFPTGVLLRGLVWIRSHGTANDDADEGLLSAAATRPLSSSKSPEVCGSAFAIWSLFENSS